MLQKRRAFEWTCAVPESQRGKRVKDTPQESMDIEFESESFCSLGNLMVFEDEDTILDRINACKYIVNPMYNDTNLLDREIKSTLVSAVLNASE